MVLLVTLKMPLIIILLLINSMALAQDSDYKQAYENYLQSIDKPVMEAQAELSYVQDYFLKYRGHRSEVYVVVILRDEAYRWEQVYIKVLLWEDDIIGGQLVNEMTIVSGYPQGAEFVIEQERVIDWLIIHKDGKQEGNFVKDYFQAKE